MGCGGSTSQPAHVVPVSTDCTKPDGFDGKVVGNDIRVPDPILTAQVSKLEKDCERIKAEKNTIEQENKTLDGRLQQEKKRVTELEAILADAEVISNNSNKTAKLQLSKTVDNLRAEMAERDLADTDRIIREKLRGATMPNAEVTMELQESQKKLHVLKAEMAECATGKEELITQRKLATQKTMETLSILEGERQRSAALESEIERRDEAEANRAKLGELTSSNVIDEDTVRELKEERERLAALESEMEMRDEVDANRIMEEKLNALMMPNAVDDTTVDELQAERERLAALESEMWRRDEEEADRIMDEKLHALMMPKAVDVTTVNELHVARKEVAELTSRIQRLNSMPTTFLEDGKIEEQTPPESEELKMAREEAAALASEIERRDTSEADRIMEAKLQELVAPQASEGSKDMQCRLMKLEAELERRDYADADRIMQEKLICLTAPNSDVGASDFEAERTRVEELQNELSQRDMDESDRILQEKLKVMNTPRGTGGPTVEELSTAQNRIKGLEAEMQAQAVNSAT